MYESFFRYFKVDWFHVLNILQTCYLDNINNRSVEYTFKSIRTSIMDIYSRSLLLLQKNKELKQEWHQIN